MEVPPCGALAAHVECAVLINHPSQVSGVLLRQARVKGSFLHRYQILSSPRRIRASVQPPAHQLFGTSREVARFTARFLAVLDIGGDNALRSLAQFEPLIARF